jgi:Helicase conserved C-terminal domain
MGSERARTTSLLPHWHASIKAVSPSLFLASASAPAASNLLAMVSWPWWAATTGSMTIEQRNWAIEQFTTSPDVNMFIIQIDCGGVGLNLQMATRVYINSLQWNASNELQAISRAHRTGQNQKVTVTRLVIEDTIDEYFIKTQDGKLKITSETLNDPHILNQLMDNHGKTMTLAAKDMVTIFK